ncbi:preprotein translocase subunit SecG [Patescibacteria group bacterium]|nr:preprotein translocase subunit SecG [Patescibacteria group bacterium]MBU4141276.1 preprotein translocase subunit SecG [Patescibacteria group bacterium]MBU4338704.1 preprotein translocase subunit SecG [Patescibacteria group bacterium]MBU4580518.1 preprotein translocase subunit SecG [Patescibacteria group bacterium]
MNLPQIIEISQIGVSILLIISILLQARGVGLGSTFGGEGNFYFTKRGAEKTIFILTIILAIAFLGLSFYSLMVQ